MKKLSPEVLYILLLTFILEPFHRWLDRTKKGMKIITSPVQMPVIQGAFEPDHYERGLDPWHREAFPLEFQKLIPDLGPRRTGWIGVDYWGNAIIFVPDGTEIKLPEETKGTNDATT